MEQNSYPQMFAKLIWQMQNQKLIQMCWYTELEYKLFNAFYNYYMFW